jgi:hypothetical protein
VSNKDFNEEHKYHAVAARCFANALSFLLEDNEGIVAQGRDEDGQICKFAVWSENEKIRFQQVDQSLSIGRKFWMHNDESEAITKATIEGTDVIII